MLVAEANQKFESKSQQDALKQEIKLDVGSRS